MLFLLGLGAWGFHSCDLSPDPKANLKDGGELVETNDQNLLALCEDPEVTVEAIEAILKAGADVNERDEDGKTPLMTAAERHRDPEVIEILLEAGADAKAKDKKGKTAADHAKDNENIYKTKEYWKLTGKDGGELKNLRKKHRVASTPIPAVENRVAAWTKNCVSGKCRIYTFTDVQQYLSRGSESVRMLLEVTDSRDIILTALYTRDLHKQMWSTNKPTYIRFNGKEYIPVRYHFDKKLPGSLTVDGRRIATLAVRNQSQLKAQSDDFNDIAKALEIGSSATIEYALTGRGKGQKASFSLTGFMAVFTSLSPSAVARQDLPRQVDPISVLKPLLGRNRFGVSARDLRVKKNPYGSGAFVYAPNRYLWFVKSNIALKLNGAANRLTPSLPFPNDASLDFWEGTGLSESNATSRGLKLVFSR